MSDAVRLIRKDGKTLWRSIRFISSQASVKLVQTSYRISPSGVAQMENKEIPLNFLRDNKTVPYSDPPRNQDIDLLCQFFNRRYAWCPARDQGAKKSHYNGI